MSDFVPDDMLTLELYPNEEFTLHETVDLRASGQSQYIRGAYFVKSISTEFKSNIDFFILDPNYKVIFSRRAKDEGIFYFNSTVLGQYSFVFSNLNDKDTYKLVTVALHPGADSDPLEDAKQQAEIQKMAKETGLDQKSLSPISQKI